MLTGSRPWEGDSAAAVALARLSGPIPDPRSARPSRAARSGRDHAPRARARRRRSVGVGRGLMADALEATLAAGPRSGRRPDGLAPGMRPAWQDWERQGWGGRGVRCRCAFAARQPSCRGTARPNPRDALRGRRCRRRHDDPIDAGPPPRPRPPTRPPRATTTTTIADGPVPWSGWLARSPCCCSPRSRSWSSSWRRAGPTAGRQGDRARIRRPDVARQPTHRPKCSVSCSPRPGRSTRAGPKAKSSAQDPPKGPWSTVAARST